MQPKPFPKFRRLDPASVGTSRMNKGENHRTGEYYTQRANASRDRNVLLQNAYGTNEKLGRALTSDRKGREGAPLMGMDELYHILCDMRRDIKKVSDAQSLPGAQKWAAKRGDGYSAADTDLNGDEIKEIVVFDPYGNPIMINGYTTKDSQWATNYKYFEANPTKEERKVTSKKQFMDKEFNVQYLDERHPGKITFDTPEWVERAVAHNYKISKPRDKTPYQLFSSVIVKRLFNEYKRALTNRNAPGDAQVLVQIKKSFMKVSALMWKWCILRPVIKHIWGSDGDDIFMKVEHEATDDNTVIDMYKKLKSHQTVRELCKVLIDDLAFTANNHKGDELLISLDLYRSMLAVGCGKYCIIQKWAPHALMGSESGKSIDNEVDFVLESMASIIESLNQAE